MARDSRLKRAGVSGFNKPKRSPSHKTKSHVVVLQSDIEEAMKEDELFRLRVVNKALKRENKQLKEQIKIMGEAHVNKAKEESDATNG